MTVDINSLDLLPAEAKGLWPCQVTCYGYSCGEWRTCGYTDPLK
ncbi:hypothetical protein [Nonomuraea cavernae]